MIRIVFITGFIIVSIACYGQYSINFGKSANGIKVIKNDDSELVLSVKYAGIDKIDVNTSKGTFSQLVLEGAYRTGSVGNPQLPSTKKLIQVPIGAELDIEVVSYEYRDYNLQEYGIQNKLLPFQPSYPKNIDPTEQEFKYNTSEYLKNEFSDIELAHIEPLGILRGVNLAQVTLNPVRYNPVKDRIRIYNNIDVKVTYRNANILKTNNLIRKGDSPYFSDIQGSIINFIPTTKESYEGNPDHTKYPIKYLIVTAPEFEAQLNDFVAWKTQKGFEVIMVTTDEIGATSANIKTWIHAQYNAGTETDPAPTFFLLVGDTDQIPASQIGDASNKATDLYYACVDGADDIFPDMYYGRFSAQNATQLQNMLDKVLYYEKYEFSDASFLNNITLIAGADASWNPSVGQPTINYGTENYFNVENGFATINKYLSSYTGCYEDERFRVGMINYTAHCNETSWQNPALTQSAVNSMSNENKYPLAIGNCCLAADFGYSECLGETWMRKANGGSVAYIGSSPSSYWYEDFYWSVGAHPYSAGNHPTFEGSTLGAYDAPYVSDYLCVDALIFVGNLAVTEAHDQNYSSSISTKYYWEAYNCLSDPSLFIYLTEGIDNTVSHLPTVPIGVSEYEISAVAGSYVAISKDSVLHGAALVPESGTVIVSIDPITTGGNVDVIVTKSQYKPYVTSIPAVPLVGPYLSLNEFEISDASGDNIVQVGESLNINLTIKNIGSEPSENVSASITTSDPYVLSVSNNIDVAFPNIAADSSATVSGEFDIVIKDSVPDQHVVVFNVTMVDNSTATKKTYESTKTITLNAPVLELSDNMILDDSGTNGNGLLDPGEIANLTVTIANTGHAQVSSTAHLSFSTKNPYLTILSSSDILGNIAPDSSAIAKFIVEADTTTPHGTLVSVSVEAVGGETPLYFDHKNYDVIIGQIPEVIIGNGTEETQNYPFNNYYENNKTQILYTHEDLGIGSKVITDIAFDVAIATAAAGKRDLTGFSIKIIHTELDELLSFVDMTEATTVFTQDVYELTGNTSWETFDFIDPYAYDGVSNLIIEVLWGDNGEYAASSDRTKVNSTATTYNSVAYGYSDSQTPPNLSGTGAIRPNLLMHVGEAHTLTMEVLDTDNNPIEGALVIVDGVDKITDTNGKADYIYTTQQYGLNYNVVAHGYFETSGTIDLNSEALTESIVLVAKSIYDITFNITNGGTAVVGATIKFNNATMETNASGLAVFNNVVEDTSYIFSVNKTNYVTVVDTIDVNANVTVDVSLVDHIFTPVINEVVNRRDGEAKLLWTAVAVTNFEDSFEDYENWVRAFGEYTLIDGDGLSVYGAENYDYPEETTPTSFRIMNSTLTTPVWGELAANTGNKIAASFCANGGLNNDWLITPQLSIGSNFEFSFYAKSVTNQYGLERFKVYISTESPAIEDFVLISDGEYVEAPTTWAKFSYDLTSYFGENIYVAIQCVSDDAFVFMVDDLKCMTTDSKTENKLFQGYTVYLDDFTSPVAEGIQDMEYVYNSLTNGQTYTAGLKGIYTTGESGLVTYDFTYSQVYTVVFSVTENGNPIQGAEVEFTNETLLTNASGIATFDLESATAMAYTINYNGYYAVSGNIDVTSDITEDIALVFIPDVTFEVVDQDGIAVEGVKIEFNDEILFTDFNGEITFVDVKAADEKPFTASLVDYLTELDTVKIADIDTTVKVTLYELPEVTFVIKDVDNAPVEGARIYFESYEQLTNVEGIAVFENVQPNNAKAIEVTFESHITYNDTIFLGLTDQIVNITLYEVPNVYFTIANGTNALEGVSITMNEETMVSDVNGKATFSDIESGTYIYTALFEGYHQVVDTIIVDINDIYETVELKIIPDVNFVIEANGSPMENVKITFGDKVLMTSTSGQASFIDVPIGDYEYAVFMEGYYPVTGMCTVADLDIQMSIDLAIIPDVKIIVTDGDNLIAGAIVEMNGKTKISNTKGEVVFVDVESGKYGFTIEKNLYFTIQDTIEVGSVDVNEAVIIELENYDVTFIVNDGSEVIENAYVIFNGETKVTNSSGEVVFENVTVHEGYNFTISKDGYISATGLVDVVDENVTENITLELIVHTVTFYVADKSGFVEGAIVTFDEESMLTNNMGVAVFKNVVPGSNKVFGVSKVDTHHEYADVLTVDSSIDVYVSLDIVDVDLNKDIVFNVYPNPSSGLVNINLIDFENVVSINVTDENGKIIKTIDIVNKLQQVDLSSLSKGIYFILVKSEKNSHIRKIVLE